MRRRGSSPPWPAASRGCRGRRAGRASRADGRHAASSSGWPAAWRRPRRSIPSATLPFEIGVPSRRSSAPSRPSTRPWTTSRSRRGWSTSPRCWTAATLIRSHVVADLGNILHSRHQYHWHTGYVPPQTVACPHLGSWIARVRGPNNPAIPAFINIGQRLEGRRRIGGAEGVHHRRLLRQRVWPVQFPVSDRRHRRRAPAEGHDARAVRDAARRRYRRLLQAEPRRRAGQRLPSRVDAARHGQRPSAAQFAGARRLRPDQGAEGELRPLQHRPVRPGLPAGPPADRGRGALHRGDDRVRPVPALGHARERPHHRRDA